MNNAYFIEEELEDKPIDSSLEQARLTKLIEAIANVLSCGGWKDLEEIHFSQEVERIKRLLLLESQKSTVEEKEMYKLQGELKWAKRYADLRQFAVLLKKQLDVLKKHG